MYIWLDLFFEGIMRFLVLVFCFFSGLSFGQLSQNELNTIDSLEHVINSPNHDTVIVNAYIEWDNLIWYVDADLDLELNQKIYTICDENLEKDLIEVERHFFLSKKAFALNAFGSIYFDRGDYELSLSNHNKSLKIREELQDERGISVSLNNIGNVYNYQGDYSRALNHYLRSLKIIERLGDQTNVGHTLNNIGVIYKEQGDFELALDYFNRSLEIREAEDDQYSIAGSLNNIGMVYSYIDRYDTAIICHTKSLEICETLNHKNGISSALNNLAICHKSLKKYDLAIDYNQKSLSIEKELGDQEGMATSMNNIASIYSEMKNYDKTISYANEALEIANKIGAAVAKREASYILYFAYKSLDKNDQALRYYEQYISHRDSMLNEKNQKEILSQEYQYKYEKQVMADSVKNAEAQKVKDALLIAEQEENKRRKQQSYFLYIGLVLTIIFGVFIYNRLKVTRNQKLVIESQKQKVDHAFNELEKKNIEILDSISYAKRIQSAILPPNKVVKSLLKNSFILYKPKDIVAGDFYWIEHKDGKVLFAAADCTGHGVPGAMVSVICNNALNRSVREHHLTDPGQILDMTRKIVVEEFEKSDEAVKDGMDIALCVLDDHKLHYAGANNPLWIIRNNELREVKADKQPIGKFDNIKPYQTTTFDLEKGDSIYIFSDGYVDQFGGEKEKKFKTKAFRSLLLNIQSLDLESQKEKIEQTFEDWRGNIEQVDDICIIGVKI